MRVLVNIEPQFGFMFSWGKTFLDDDFLCIEIPFVTIMFLVNKTMI